MSWGSYSLYIAVVNLQASATGAQVLFDYYLFDFLVYINSLTACKMGDAMKVEVKEIDKLLEMDGYLKPHEREIRRR